MLSCAKRAAGVKKGCIVLSIHKKTALATSMLVAFAFSGLYLVRRVVTHKFNKEEALAMKAEQEQQ